MTERYKLHTGNSLNILQTLDSSSIDSIVTDPPYGLSEEHNISDVLKCWLEGKPYVNQVKGFMGEAWDGFVPGPDIYQECLRVLKPGGYLLAFASSRTQDLTAMALRLAGFEIRDTITYYKDMNPDLEAFFSSLSPEQQEAFLRLTDSQEGGLGSWVYSTGKPKGADISQLMDRSSGAFPDRPNIGWRLVPKSKGNDAHNWGYESLQNSDSDCVIPITGPASEKAQKWEGYYTALKPAYEPIIVARKPLALSTCENVDAFGTGALNIDGTRIPSDPEDIQKSRNSILKILNKRQDGVDYNTDFEVDMAKGRYTTNLILDDTLTSQLPPGSPPFYYSPKVSKQDRFEGVNKATGVVHPTVKPTSLMRYLTRLVTPAGGLVLDPFMGSGSTGKACMWEGFSFVGVDLNPDYVSLAEERIAYALQNTPPADPRLDHHSKYIASRNKQEQDDVDIYQDTLLAIFFEE